MAKQFLDYDEVTGTAYYTEDNDLNGETILETVQDVEPLLERNLELRNSGSCDLPSERPLHHYAEVPNVIAMELLKKDINVWNLRAEDFPRFAKEIEQNYPYLKVTNKRAWSPK